MSTEIKPSVKAANAVIDYGTTQEWSLGGGILKSRVAEIIARETNCDTLKETNLLLVSTSTEMGKQIGKLKTERDTIEARNLELVEDMHRIANTLQFTGHSGMATKIRHAITKHTPKTSEAKS